MSTIVYRISVLLGSILADVPVGPNLEVFWLLWRWSLVGSCSVAAPSPRPCRRGAPRSRRATLGSGPDVWALGHAGPREGVAPGSSARRLLACPSV
jgi:hypothetical protein